MELVPRERDRVPDGVRARVRVEPSRALPVQAQEKVVPGQAAARDKEEGTDPVGAPVLGAKEEEMPGGDRTGPLGEGPMTGRGLGFCGGHAAPGGFQGTGGWGRGFGRGRGFAAGGRGRRNVFWATGVPPAVPMNERQWLESRAEALEREMAAIRTQLEDLVVRDRREPEGADE